VRLPRFSLFLACALGSNDSDTLFRSFIPLRGLRRRLNPEREDHWVFGDKHTGAYLLKFRWFKIVRHRLVRGRASPDDPGLRDYRWARRKINSRFLSTRDVRLAAQQDWRCPVFGMDLLNGEELHRHHKQPRCLGGSDTCGNRKIVHLYCHQ
jgi:RNA-directed DNA polymerase